MLNRTTSFGECSLEQIACDERADSLRNEVEAYDRALFLSEATSDARREPTEAELDAEYQREMLRHLDTIWKNAEQSIITPDALRALLTIQAALAVGCLGRRAI